MKQLLFDIIIIPDSSCCSYHRLTYGRNRSLWTTSHNSKQGFPLANTRYYSLHPMQRYWVLHLRNRLEQNAFKRSSMPTLQPQGARQGIRCSLSWNKVQLLAFRATLLLMELSHHNFLLEHHPVIWRSSYQCSDRLRWVAPILRALSEPSPVFPGDRNQSSEREPLREQRHQFRLVMERDLQQKMRWVLTCFKATLFRSCLYLRNDEQSISKSLDSKLGSSFYIWFMLNKSISYGHF